MALPGRPGGRRATKKWLWGCCGGCAGLAFLIVVLIVVGLYFLARSLPLLPSETFLTPNADAFLIVQISPEDESLVAVLHELIQNPPPDLKLAEEQRKQLLARSDEVAQTLMQTLPARLVVLARHIEREGQEGGREFALSGVMSIRGLSGLGGVLLKTVVSTLLKRGGRIERYDGVKIGVSPTGVRLAKLGNNFMFAADTESVTAWVDRIREQARLMKTAPEGQEPVLSYQGPDLLKEMLSALERSAQLRFASVNSHGEIGAFLEALQAAGSGGAGSGAGAAMGELAQVLSGSDVASARVLAVGGVGRIVEPDTARFELLIRADDEAFAGELREELVNLLESSAPDMGIEEIEGAAEGSLVRIAFSRTHLRDTLLEAVRRGRQAEGPSPAPSQR